MRIRRTLARFLVICAVLCAGCSWLQNEFFSLDRAAPPPEPEVTKSEWPW